MTNTEKTSVAEIIRKLQKDNAELSGRVQKLEKTVQQVTNDNELLTSSLPSLLDRLEAAERGVFTLASVEIDRVTEAVSAGVDGAKERQEMWLTIQGTVSPEMFTRTYGIDPDTGEAVDATDL